MSVLCQWISSRGQLTASVRLTGCLRSLANHLLKTHAHPLSLTDLIHLTHFSLLHCDSSHTLDTPERLQTLLKQVRSNDLCSVLCLYVCYGLSYKLLGWYVAFL